MSKPESESLVQLRVVCEPLPPKECGELTEIEIGIQKGEASCPPTRQSTERAEFEISVRVRRDPKTGGPNFLGEWAHGKPGERFLYLTWTACQGGLRERYGRMKVPLTSIPWEIVERAVAETRVLEARVSGIGRHGKPACATVPLLDGGWQLADPTGRE